MPREAMVQVEIVLPAGARATAAGARVIVRVEDVTRADAAARVAGEVVAEWPRTARRGRATGAPLQVTVPVRVADERADYSVRVHADADGDGEVSAGDYVSTESYPVLTRGRGSVVRVTLRAV
ncbi:MAG: YbaY family lipoprotein [Gemmatimonadaceae bacterium]